MPKIGKRLLKNRQKKRSLSMKASNWQNDKKGHIIETIYWNQVFGPSRPHVWVKGS